MKRYIGLLLLLFVMQNVCAMEPQIISISSEQDEKCKLVAKYIYKYPAGKNLLEAYKIDQFLKLSCTNTMSEQTVLSRCVNKYKIRLQDMESEEISRIEVREILHGMHTKNFPSEIKQKIFTQALWDYASQYYVIDNTCKFVAMDGNLIPELAPFWLNEVYMPYFLAEIHENNDQYIFFYKTKLDCLAETEALEAKGLNSKYIQVSDFDYKGKIFVEDFLEKKIWLYIKNSYPWFSVAPLTFKKNVLKDLVFFLDKKKSRVHAFKQSFNEKIESLLCMNGDGSVNKFIELLTLYKNRPKDIAAIYEFIIGKPASTILQQLSSMYEREIRRNTHSAC